MPTQQHVQHFVTTALWRHGSRMPCVRKKHCYNGVGDNHDDDNEGAATTAAAADDDADEGDDDDTD